MTAHSPPFAVLDFPDASGARRPVRFAEPTRVLVAATVADVRPVLDAVEAACVGGQHAVGFVSYEAAPAFDAALPVRDAEPGLPLAWFALFDGPGEAPPLDPPDARDDERLVWTPEVARDAYDAAIAAIREGIARGDWYQVNYTLRLHAPAPRDPWDLFLRLRDAQPAAHAAYLDLGGRQLLSVSPELFFAREGARVVTKPMKGTARRGRWPAEDDARAAALAASEKERAENVMIVDLLRNDLGRVAAAGSVRVERLFDVERHPTVLQMTSTVACEARPGVSLGDLFAALFPCGSVTGAPKVTAMRAIAALETSARGAYCGAVGWVRPGGDCTFSVGIRTAVVDAAAGRARYGTGSGVTWDSRAGAEYDEALAKALVLDARRAPFELLETMRLAGGRIARMERHLARLAGSAAYFDFPPSTVEEAGRLLAKLEAGQRRHPGSPDQRLRLLVPREGPPRVENRPLAEADAGAMGAGPVRPVRLARTPVDRDDVFLHHKTTHRAAYEARRAEWPDAFDVLLWNREGELTEFTIGNVVLELDGRRVTPPRDCGLLAGTMRAELLAAGLVEERVVRVDELARATRLWLVNSVRGEVEVTLAR